MCIYFFENVTLDETLLLSYLKNNVSSAGEVSRYGEHTKGLKTKEVWFDSLEGQEIYLSSNSSKPAVEPTQPSVLSATKTSSWV